MNIILQKTKFFMKNPKIIIGPSILSADFANLQSQCKQILSDGADSLHIDIMDGNFVPNLTIGPPVVKALRKKLPEAHFDCHIMVTNPQNYISDLKKAGANCITFHYEADHQNLQKICTSIRNQGIQVGVSIKPKTELNPDFIALINQHKIDKVLVMTVQPGFGGQKFMQDMMLKVKALRTQFQWLDIQVDGGISIDNIALAAENGANSFVSGSAIFDAKDKRQYIKSLRQQAQRNFPKLEQK